MGRAGAAVEWGACRGAHLLPRGHNQLGSNPFPNWFRRDRSSSEQQSRAGRAHQTAPAGRPEPHDQQLTGAHADKTSQKLYVADRGTDLKPEMDKDINKPSTLGTTTANSGN